MDLKDLLVMLELMDHKAHLEIMDLEVKQDQEEEEDQKVQ